MPKRAPKGNGMIRQRKDKSWEGRYTIGRDPGTGKQIQRSIYGKSFDEVRKKLAEITKDIDDGVYSDGGDMTVGRWLDIWVTEYTLNIKDTTLRSYKDNINLHIKPGIGAVKLDKLSPLQIQRFYNKLSTNGRVLQKGQKKEVTMGLAAKTIRNIHAILHKALKTATRPPHNLIKYNPAEGATLPKVIQKEMKILNDDEIASLLQQSADHWHYAIYYITLFCGLRRGEALGLQWKYVHPEDEYIDIMWQLQRERKKGGVIRLVPLKNDKTRRIFPPKSVFDVLEQHKKLQDKMIDNSKDAWQSSDMVFTNSIGGYLDGDAVYKAFKTILKKAGITDIRIHDLRHTFATISIANGVDIKTLQEDLGHHDPGFTLKQYGHSTYVMKKSAATKMNIYVENLSNKSK